MRQSDRTTVRQNDGAKVKVESRKGEPAQRLTVKLPSLASVARSN
jgi:hypothetical protein